VRASQCKSLIVRVPFVIGNAKHPRDPIMRILSLLEDGCSAVDHSPRYPTDVMWLATCLSILIAKKTTGTVHLTSNYQVSRYSLVTQLTARIKDQLKSPQLMPPQPKTSVDVHALRPLGLKLSSVRAHECTLPKCPALDLIIDRYVRAFMEIRSLDTTITLQ
jgi:dTDP-4-dehydrorhamnose reductase